MSAHRVDAADRALAVVAALLPESHREWGQAMRAELAGIATKRDRRGFVAGCARAACVLPAVWRRAAAPLALLVAAVVTLVLVGDVAYLPVRLEMAGLVAAIVALALVGRRVSGFGPAAAGLRTRFVRGAGYVVLALGVLTGVVGERRYPGGHHAATIAYILAIVVYLAVQMTLLTATARGSRLPSGSFAIGAAAGGVGGIGWLVASLAHGTFGVGVLVPVRVALACALGSALLAVVRRQGLIGVTGAALAAGGSALLLIAFLANATMLAFTSTVPDIVGPVMVAGSTHAQRLRENLTESGDTYFGALVLGGLAFTALGVLIGAARYRGVATWVSGALSVVLVGLAVGASWPVNLLLAGAGVMVGVVGMAASASRRSAAPGTPVPQTIEL